MSAIDELDALTINAANSGDISIQDNAVEDDSLAIDASGPDIKTRINMNAQVKPPVRRHNVVKHDMQKALDASGQKKVVPQSSIPVQAEEETREVHVSPIDDQIGIDNPNSLLSKWVARKEEEAREWIAEKEEEKAVLAAENSDEEITISNIEDDDEFTTVDHRTLVMDEDLDFNSSSDDEEEDMSEEINEILEEDEEISEDTFDKEEVVEDEISIDDISDMHSDPDEDKEVASITVEEESIVLEDLDIEESTQDNTPIIVEDEEEEETPQVEEQDTDEILKNLQKMITEKIKPISTSLDLSSFTIAKKPTSNINEALADTSSRVIKWVLPNQQAIVKMKDFTGAELEKLREYSEDPRSIDSLRRRYKMIYDHIVSPKPQSFDVWLKCTPFSDLDHYYFAVYIANYKGANFLPVDCQNEKCNNTWVTEDINIMDMVKFEKTEDKEKFESIYHSEATAATGKGVYCTQAVAISKHFAIAFKEASLYSLLEDRLIDEKTRTKYSSFVDYLPYIDSIYIIDYANNTLVPVSYKEFPDNAVRNIRSKIQKYATIFDTFGADEFGPVKAYVRAISERNDGVSYNYPEMTCPKCGAVIKSEPASAEALVFTRYQLGSLTSTLLN